MASLQARHRDETGEIVKYDTDGEKIARTYADRRRSEVLEDAAK